MALRIETDTQIQAPVDTVWEVLTDFAAYPEWNPFIVRARGDLAPGSKLTLRIESLAGWKATNRARVLAAVPGRVLRWSARLIPVPGLAAGRHEFVLHPEGSGTRLVQTEQFSGALVPAMRKVLAKTEADFHRLNEAMRKRCETL